MNRAWEKVGEFRGGKFSAHDQGVLEEIVLRPDSTIEYYRRDTLLWRARLSLMPPEDVKGKKWTRLDIVGVGQTDPNTVAIEDGNHVWLSMRNAVDAFSLKFERH